MMGLSLETADVEAWREVIVGKDDSLGKPIQLGKAVFTRISKMEANMRPEGMDEERSFLGRFVEVRDRREEDDSPAPIKIRFFDDESQYRVASLVLSGEPLRMAYDAMKFRRTVSIKGNLVGTPRNYRIEDPHDLRVYEG